MTFAVPITLFAALTPAMGKVAVPTIFAKLAPASLFGGKGAAGSSFLGKGMAGKGATTSKGIFTSQKEAAAQILSEKAAEKTAAQSIAESAFLPAGLLGFGGLLSSGDAAEMEEEAEADEEDKVTCRTVRMSSMGDRCKVYVEFLSDA